MIIYGRLAVGKSLLPEDFADITDAVTAITPGTDGWFRVNVEGTPDAATRLAIRRRMISGSLNEEILRAYLKENGDVIDAWEPLTAATATTDQVVVRINTLTRQVNSQSKLIAVLDNQEMQEQPANRPMCTTVPVITGTPQVGQVLTVTPGVWTNSPTKYVRRWKANGEPIPLGTKVTYTLTSAEAGKVITVMEVGINADGSSSANSAATAIVVL